MMREYPAEHGFKAHNQIAVHEGICGADYKGNARYNPEKRAAPWGYPDGILFDFICHFNNSFI
jgi:hypothetical protein